MTSQPNDLHRVFHLIATVARYVDPGAVFVLVLGLTLIGFFCFYGFYKPKTPKDRPCKYEPRQGRDL